MKEIIFKHGRSDNRDEPPKSNPSSPRSNGAKSPDTYQPTGLLKAIRSTNTRTAHWTARAGGAVHGGLPVDRVQALEHLLHLRERDLHIHPHARGHNMEVHHLARTVLGRNLYEFALDEFDGGLDLEVRPVVVLEARGQRGGLE